MQVFFTKIEAVAGELHCQGRGSLSEGHVRSITDGCPKDASKIDSTVIEKAFVFPCFQSGHKEIRYFHAGNKASILSV